LKKYVKAKVSRLDRRFIELEIRLAFISFLMTILEEARHSLIFIEQDPCYTKTPERGRNTSHMP
jgi:hypothetical protein